MIPKIPITILTGFLGAGKTTLLNHLLHSDHGLRIAVLVNDFGQVNIDAQLIVGIQGETVSLANGCICCTIRDDLETAVLTLIQAPTPPEYIVIEASGVSDPKAVALTFIMSDELRAKTKLDTILAMIDTEQLLKLDGKSARLAEQQIIIADLIVLNKVDLVPKKAVRFVKKTLRELVPQARMIETTYGRVPLELILSEGQHTLETLQQTATLDIHVHPESSTSNDGPHAHVHEHEHEHHDHTLVFTTWRYHSTQPFNYQALHEVMKTLPPTIYRAKGIVYLSDSPERKHVLQLAGSRINLSHVDIWDVQPPYNELIFIGEADSIDAQMLQARFDACLAENTPQDSDSYPDTRSWVRET